MGIGDGAESRVKAPWVGSAECRYPSLLQIVAENRDEALSLGYTQGPSRYKGLSLELIKGGQSGYKKPSSEFAAIDGGGTTSIGL